MKDSISLVFVVTDTGERLAEGQKPSDRDREYSTMLHYLGHGKFPSEHSNGFYAMLSDGRPAPQANAARDPNMLVYGSVSHRLLEGARRDTELMAREDFYEHHATAIRRELSQKAWKSKMPTGSTWRACPAPVEECLKIMRDQRLELVMNKQKQLLPRETKCLETTEKARTEALERVNTGLAYLDRTAFHGVEQLNLLLGTQHPTLEDFEPPKPFHSIINHVHTISIEDAQQLLTYESLWDFLQRPNALRIRLRRIEQGLNKIVSPNVPSNGTILDRRRAVWAFMKEGVPALRQAYDKMLALAEDVATNIGAVKERTAYVPKDLLKEWEGSNAGMKKKIVRRLFAKGMAMRDMYPGKVEFTDQFTMLRELTAIVDGQAFCAQLEQFGTGLQEMRDALDFAGDE